MRAPALRAGLAVVAACLVGLAVAWAVLARSAEAGTALLRASGSEVAAEVAAIEAREGVEVSAEQQRALADGKVTDPELKALYVREMSCIRSRTDPRTTVVSGLVRKGNDYSYTIEPDWTRLGRPVTPEEQAALMAQVEEASKQCAIQETGVIQTMIGKRETLEYYQSLPPDQQRQFREFVAKLDPKAQESYPDEVRP